MNSQEFAKQIPLSHVKKIEVNHHVRRQGSLQLQPIKVIVGNSGPYELCPVETTQNPNSVLQCKYFDIHIQQKLPSYDLCGRQPTGAYMPADSNIGNNFTGKTER